MPRGSDPSCHWAGTLTTSASARSFPILVCRPGAQKHTCAHTLTTSASAPLPQARDTVPQTLVYSDLTELSPFCSSEDTFFKVPAWHRPTDWSTQKVPASPAHAGRWQFPPPNVLPHFCAPLSPEELPAFSWVAVRDRGNHRSHFLSCVMDVCSVLSYFSGF